MENKDKSAFGYGLCTAHGNIIDNQLGLTKREYFAGLAMQALLSIAPNLKKTDSEWVSRVSVGYADDLLKELEKQQPNL